jgi:predicted dehydrogenase
VSVATEPVTHAELTVEALEAGKHVVVEKPLALTLEDAGRVTAAAERTGRIVTVDHVLRHNPLVKAVETIAAEELLGRLRTVSVTNYAIVDVISPSHWFWDEERSGGILLEHGVHFFDLAAQLARSPEQEIAAFRQVRDDGRTDGMAATIQHRSGVVAHHAHVFCRSVESERTSIDVGFEHGNLTLTGWIPLEGAVWADPRLETLDRVAALLPGYRLVDDAPIPSLRATFSLHQSKQRVYEASLRALLENVQAAADGQEPVVVTLADAVGAVEVALLATAAARAA